MFALAGVVELAKPDGVTAIAGPIQVDNADSGGILRLLANNKIVDSVNVTVLDSGLLDLNGFSDTIQMLTLRAGAASGAQVTTGAGTLTLGGNVTLTTSGTGANGASISGKLDLGGATRTFNILDGAAGVDLTVAAVVSGSGGITKAGTGTLALSGANTYTGATTVNAGTLQISSFGALGGTGPARRSRTGRRWR